MGFDDSDFEKAEKVNSNTQLYKQAGNSIVVNVLERILENLLDKDEHVKILELFGGIGACSKALEIIGIDYEIADYVEIDKYAVKSFNAMHNTNFEPQDICKWDKNIECDLIMHGSPCQDFSLAGKQAGGDEGSGTRSSLMYETIRIVEKLKPKYVIWENVKNVISKKHIHNFNNYLEKMKNIGYTSYYQVLNAKDYGIPQNRERVFTISIRNNINLDFVFPPKQELKLKLKDMLEDNIDEKYYLSDELTNKIRYRFDDENVLLGGMQKNQSIKKDGICTTLTSSMGTGGGYVPMVARKYGVFDTDKSTHQASSVYDSNGLSPTLDTMQGGYRQPCIEECNKVINVGNVNPSGKGQNGTVVDSDGLARTITIEKGEGQKILIKNATKQGYLEATDGDGIDISSRMQYHRGNVQPQSIQTITTSGGNDRGVVIENKFPDLD